MRASRLLVALLAALVAGCSSLLDPAESSRLVALAHSQRLIDAPAVRAGIAESAEFRRSELTRVSLVREHGQEFAGRPNAPPELIRETVDGVFARLLERLPQDVGNIELILDDCPGFVAQAFPDGYIRICRGVLQVVRTEDEIAFVLAHELGHLLLGHDRLDRRSAIARHFMFAASETLVGDDRIRRDLGDAGAFALGVATYVAGAEVLGRATTAYSRAQERVADYLAADLLAGEYNLEAAAITFGAIRGGDVAVGVHNSHSAFEQFAQRYFSIATFGVAEGVTFGDRHPPADERLDWYLNYITRHYHASLRERPPTFLPWRDPVRANDPAVRAVARYFLSRSLADEAMFELAEALRLSEHSPTRALQYCESARLKARYALILGAEYDRDIRIRVADISYYCSDYSLSSYIYIDASLERLGGYHSYAEGGYVDIVAEFSRYMDRERMIPVIMLSDYWSFQANIDANIMSGRSRLSIDMMDWCYDEVDKSITYLFLLSHGSVPDYLIQESYWMDFYIYFQRSDFSLNLQSRRDLLCDQFYERRRLEAAQDQQGAVRPLSGQGQILHGYSSILSYLSSAEGGVHSEALGQNLLSMPAEGLAFSTVSRAELYTAPSTGATVDRIVEAGQRLIPTDRYLGGFVQVRYDGAVGWVQGDLIEIPASN